MLNVYERVGISVVEVYKRVGKTVTSVCSWRPKRTTRTKDLVAVKKSRTFPGFVIYTYLIDSVFTAVKRDAKF